MQAQNDQRRLEEVRTIYLGEFGVTNKASISYSADLGQFFVLAKEDADHTTAVALTPYEDLVGSERLDFGIDGALNTAFDDGAKRLFMLDPQLSELIQIQLQAGRIPSRGEARFNIQPLGLQSATGMAVDSGKETLFILDAAAAQVVQMKLKSAGGPDATPITRIDLSALDTPDLHGLAINPENGHFYVLSPSKQTVHELAKTGELVATYDVTDLALADPTGLLVIPSSDLTDAEDVWHLVIVDSGAADEQQAGAETGIQGPFHIFLPYLTGRQEGKAAMQRQPGRIVEVAFDPRGPRSVQATALASLSLVQTIDLSAIDPPSPDPSGLAYVSTSNHLVMSDGEVEETINGITHFQGANVWEFTLSGSVVRTANISEVEPTVAPMTNEPTGIAWDPASGDFFVSDDVEKEVYRLHPGGDGQIGTADDTWDHFDTEAVGNVDPEGIGYDTWHDRLFVADGVNREIYQYTLTGTLIGHFDIERYGLIDPEGVEFNPDKGTLFILDSNRRDRVIIETTTDGDLLRIYDISAADSRKAAGLAYAPASDGSGAQHFYIVDRGRDNNPYPNIIDGKMYELTGPPACTGNQTVPCPPTATATSTDTPTPIPTATPTATDTPTATPTDTPTPVPTATPTNTSTAVPTDTPTPVPTATPTNTSTAVPTDTPTPILTATPTATDTPIPTDTSTATPTDIPAPTATNTPTPTPTATPTDTPTPVPTATATNTPTPTPTDTPTSVPTATATNTPAATPTDTPTSVPTATATNTPAATPTDTPTTTPTDTPTAISTNTPTDIPATDTPTPTPTATNTPAPTPTATSTPSGAGSPSLTANFTTGTPGSFFTFTGDGFSPYATATISVNGVQVTQLQTDGKGHFIFTLDTAGLPPGTYTVRVQVNLATEISIELDPDAPLRPNTSNTQAVKVPSSIALTERIYLPLTIK